MTVVPRTEELIAAPASVVVAGPRTDVGVCPCGLFSKCTNLRHSTIGCTHCEAFRFVVSTTTILRSLWSAVVSLTRKIQSRPYPISSARCLDPAAVKSIFLYQQQSYSVRRAETSLLLTA